MQHTTNNNMHTKTLNKNMHIKTPIKARINNRLSNVLSQET